MTITQDMTLTGRQCRQLLDDEAVAAIAAYIGSLQDASGGFHGRDGRPDLYYSLFAAECLDLLEHPLPAGFLNYVLSFGRGDELDFIHLSCLGRCLALATPADAYSEIKNAIGQGLRERQNSQGPTVYSTFVRRLTLEEMGLPLDDQARWHADLESRKTSDGGYAEEGLGHEGTTPVTAAAAVLQSGNSEKPAAVIEWLMNRVSWMGGFHATPSAPVPDLLSTATALFALKRLEQPLDTLREPALMFVESLWQENGGFTGHLAEPQPDAEYTFYGLLALGTLTP